MRALRSRTVESDNNHEHTDEETENHVEESVTKKAKSKKIKRHVSEQNDEESINTFEENGKKKRKSKRVKKSKTANTEQVNYDQISEPDTNISSSSLESRKKSETDNDQETEKKFNNRKIKKLRRRLNDSNSVRLSAQMSHVFNTSMEQQQTTENSSENDQKEEKVAKKKKPKKTKKELNKSVSENETNVNTNNIDSEQKTEDIVEKKSQRKRKTSLCFPDFCNVVTSTVMKPKRPETKYNESQLLAQNCDRIDENKCNNSSVHATDSPNKTFKNNSTFNKSKNSEKNESIENRKSNSVINNTTRRETFNKKSKTPLIKKMDSVIAISDSPSIINVRQNTFNKSSSSEFLSDAENETNNFEQSSKILQENQRKSLVNRRETFNRLPKNKLSSENSVITILDSPDQSLKQNTFDKSSITETEETYDNKKSIDSIKKKRSSNGLNILNNSGNHSINFRNTFSKSPKISDNFSSKINYDENSGLNDIGESILEDVLDISDSPNKTSTLQNSFNVSDNTSITKNNTYDLQISNSSGNWQIHKNDCDTSKNENKENKSQKSNTSNESDITVKNESISFSPKDKNLRKKWLKFPRHSTDAQNVLDQISSPRLQKKMNATKVIQKIINTPTDLYNLQKSSIAPSNLSVNKTINKKTPIKSCQKPMNIPSSSKKSITKRTIMPNFALIHKKAFEKMENLKEYSERKKERAQKLLQNTGTKQNSSIKSVEPKTKSSRQLFASNTNDTKFNRFGFKIGDQVKKFIFNSELKSENNVAIAKPVVKPSVFTRSDMIAVANKNKVTANNRDNKRDMLKGVRTNRRFELLMQMRNK